MFIDFNIEWSNYLQFKYFSLGKRIYTRSTITGRGLTPFDRETTAFSTIQEDEQAKLDPPVVEAYGWFTIPTHFSSGRFHLSTDQPLQVIAKKLVRAANVDFNLVTPERMIRHRETLDRLGIYDTDISAKNFLGGKLTDLSASYVLPLIYLGSSYDIKLQRAQMMTVVLDNQDLLHPPFWDLERSEQLAIVQDKWDLLQEKYKEKTA
jgi:hypothetical protein